ncbi:MAG: tetratricopeptide repeat protein, partial [Chloroflexi bacterium]|nr:tetratricopeptide repeat protein [Chloroflexota bacterium]
MNTQVKSGGARGALLRFCSSQAWLLPLLLVVIILLLFSNSLGREFIWDDAALIQQNYLIRDFDNLPQFFTRDFWAFAEGEGKGHDLYRPLVSLSYLIDSRLWGNRPPCYHFTNLLFHILSTILVYFILRGILEKRWSAWLGALLFAIHPIHTEAVSWISGRTDVVCGFFFFLALFLYIGSRKGGQWTYLAGSLVAFLLALLSKEMAITLPLIIAVYNLCFDKSPQQERWWDTVRARLGRAVIEPLPYLVVVVLYLTIRLQVLGFVIKSKDKMAESLQGFSSLQNPGATLLLLPVKIMALDLRLLVVPFPLNAHRLVSDLASNFGLTAWLSLLAAVAVLALSILALRRAPAYAFAGLFFFVTILPVSGLLSTGDFVAERFLYIPSLTVCLAAALLCTSLWQRRRTWGLVLLLLIALPWVIFTYRRNADWRDGLTFWSKTVAASPRSTIAHNHLGLEFWYRGQYEQAIAEFEQVLQMDEENKNAYNNLAGVCFSQERFQEAEAYYHKAIAIAPENALFHLNLGVVYERLDDSDKAVTAYQEALALNPRLAAAYYNLGLLHSRMGRWAEAIFCLERVLDIDPTSAAAHNSLGLIYLDLELFPEAVFEFEQAMWLDPASAEILNNLGLTYLHMEQFNTAIQVLERALEVTPEFAPAHFNLGLAYLESGSGDKALRELAIAAELDPANEEARRLIKELGS